MRFGPAIEREPRSGSARPEVGPGGSDRVARRLVASRSAIRRCSLRSSPGVAAPRADRLGLVRPRCSLSPRRRCWRPASPPRLLLWPCSPRSRPLRVALDWPMSDNHGYLLAYLVQRPRGLLRDPRPRAALARNARLLIGLAFALATLQKLLAPDYVDGTFFRCSLAVDPASRTSAACSGATAGARADTRAARGAALGAAAAGRGVRRDAGAAGGGARLDVGDASCLEGAVALVFLAPSARGLGRAATRRCSSSAPPPTRSRPSRASAGCCSRWASPRARAPGRAGSTSRSSRWSSSTARCRGWPSSRTCPERRLHPARRRGCARTRSAA